MRVTVRIWKCSNNSTSFQEYSKTLHWFAEVHVWNKSRVRKAMAVQGYTLQGPYPLCPVRSRSYMSALDISKTGISFDELPFHGQKKTDHGRYNSSRCTLVFSMFIHSSGCVLMYTLFNYSGISMLKHGLLTIPISANLKEEWSSWTYANK